MKRAGLLIGVALLAFTTTEAFADHFARQRQEAAARASAARPQVQRHWGGPTTQHRFYPSHNSHFGSTGLHTGRNITVIQRTQFVPVYPYGFGGYGGYGWGGHGHGFHGRNPYFGHGFPGGQHIHIHREIRR